MQGRRGVLAIAAAVVLLLAAGVMAWQSGWPPGVFGRGVSPASPPTAVIRFTSDQGVILTGPADRYRLAAEVVGADGHRRPGATLRWRSSDPAVVSVSAGGLVTAISGTGSAVITVSAAGAAPQAAQVLVARPAAGTVLVPTGIVLGARDEQVRLRRTSLASALKAGQILVSNGRLGGGLLAKVVSVSVSGQSVSVVTTPASLAQAFTALSVHTAGAPVSTSVPAAVVGTVAARKITCKLSSGAKPVSLADSRVSVPATIALEAVLVTRAGAVDQFQLAVRATLPVTVNAGTVTVGPAGHASATCELPLPKFPVPTPVFVGPVDLSGAVTPVAGVGVSFDGGAGLSLPGPVMSDTVTAFDGIRYTASGGWQSVDDNNPGRIAISPGGPPAFSASVSLGFSLFLRTDFEAGGAIVGQQLAGTAFAFANTEGDYTITMHPPFSRLAERYTGPGWDTSLRLTGGPQVKATGDLAQLLSWIGVNTPQVRWKLYDLKFPVAASPAVTAAAVPGRPADRVTRLSVSLPHGYGGDKVEFIQYPSGGGSGRVVTKATVSGQTAVTTWTHAASAAGTTIRALVYGPVYGTAGYPYATSRDVTVPGLAPVDWNSRQYGLTCGNTVKTPFNIAFSSGSATARGPGIGPWDRWDMSIEQVAHGVLPTLGDATAVLFRCSPQPSNFFVEELRIYRTADGSEIGRVPELPDNGGFLPGVYKSVAIADGHVGADVMFYGLGDSHASGPSVPGHLSWSWNGQAFITDAAQNPAQAASCTAAELTQAIAAANPTVPSGWTVTKYACESRFALVEIYQSSVGYGYAVLKQEPTGWQSVYGLDDGTCLFRGCPGFQLPLPASLLQTLQNKADITY